MADATAGPTGVAVVDKEAGWTSHDVVGRARRVFGTKKVGHAGTLDPDATGVLVLGVGAATRLMQFVTGTTKSYVGEVVLGTETSTLDSSGEVVASHDMSGVTLADVGRAATTLTGDLMQVPPMVSAKKVGGRKLYELAREGKEVERAPSAVTVSRFDVAPTAQAHVFAIEVDCSSGTYIRSLAADLGHALGGGAHLRALRRTAVGRFDLAQAHPVDDAVLLPAVEMVAHLGSVTVDGDLAAAVGHGKVLPCSVLGVEGDGPWAVLIADGRLAAVYQQHPTNSGEAKPTLVLPTPA